MSKCLKFKHFTRFVYLMITASWCLSTFAQGNLVMRKPANFVPDDDMIIVPMVVERNFIEDFNEKHKSEFKSARKKLDYWMTQEQYAEDYGLEDTGVVVLPTADQKERFFRKNYLRFMQKDVEKSNQAVVNELVNDWNTNDEIDSIEANEQRDEFIVKAKRNKGQRVYTAKKEVKVAGTRFKFDIQPRVEMGMMKVRIDTPIFRVRAWIGINGNQEVKISRKFTSTNTKAMVNYYIEQNRLLSVVDQPLAKNWSMRLTHDKIVKDFDSINQTGTSENNSLQFRFGMGF